MGGVADRGNTPLSDHELWPHEATDRPRARPLFGRGGVYKGVKPVHLVHL